MISTWAEMAEKFSSGEIKKEEYDTWRYQYPDHTKLQGYVQGIMSKELSDMLLEELKKQNRRNKMESFDWLCKCHHIPSDGKFFVGKLYKWTAIIDGIAVYDELSEPIPFGEIEFLWYFSKQ